MSPVVEHVEVVDLCYQVEPGDYGFFVGVHSGRHSGWYGPVSYSVATYIERYLTGLVVGRSIFDHVAVLRSLRLAVACTGPQVSNKIRSWAIGAVDCAVWDLHGRVASAPVAYLLADRPASSVTAYVSWLRFDVATSDAAETIALVARGGWSFTKWGLTQNIGENARQLGAVAKRVALAAGGQAAFDALRAWDLDLTLTFAENVDLAHLIWLEDPLSDELATSYEQVAAKGLPLALGEHVLIDDKVERLWSTANLKAFTLDVVGCGGLTRAVSLTEAARRHGMSVTPHGRSLVPALHLAAAYTDVIPCVEYQLQWEPRRQRIYVEPRVPTHGQILIGQLPGLGLTPRRIDACYRR